MVPRHPHLAAQERVLHEVVRERLRVRVRPEALHVVPAVDRVLAPERRHDALAEGRDQVALEEPVDQAVGADRHAEARLARLVLHVLRPLEELGVRQGVDFRALGQVLEGLLVRDHDVRRLHPRDVELSVRPHLAERQQVLRDSGLLQLLCDVLEVDEVLLNREEVAVEASEQADRSLAGLRLRRDPVEPDLALPDRRRHVVDVAVEALEQRVANLVDLAHLRELVGEEDDVAGVSMGRGCRTGAPERGDRDESESGRETNDASSCVSNPAHRSFLSLRCPVRAVCAERAFYSLIRRPLRRHVGRRAGRVQAPRSTTAVPCRLPRRSPRRSAPRTLRAVRAGAALS